MAVQTTYTREHERGFEGSVVDLSNNNIITKIAEGSDIGEGRAVVRGTQDRDAILPSATGQEFIGVTTSTTAGQADGSDNFNYEENSPMNVLDFGRIYVFCEDGCSAGDDVFFRHTASGGNTVLGRFRTDADTATADQIVGAKFETTVSAGEIAIIKLV
jgi:hypothetical protein